MLLLNFGEQRQMIFASQKKEENASKWGQLYHCCISDGLSVWDSTAVNNSMPTQNTKSGLSIVPMFMCRQTDNLWFKLIQKVGNGKVKVTF